MKNLKPGDLYELVAGMARSNDNSTSGTGPEEIEHAIGVDQTWRDIALIGDQDHTRLVTDQVFGPKTMVEADIENELTTEFMESVAQDPRLMTRAQVWNVLKEDGRYRQFELTPKDVVTISNRIKTGLSLDDAVNITANERKYGIDTMGRELLPENENLPLRELKLGAGIAEEAQRYLNHVAERKASRRASRRRKGYSVHRTDEQGKALHNERKAMRKQARHKQDEVYVRAQNPRVPSYIKPSNAIDDIDLRMVFDKSKTEMAFYLSATTSLGLDDDNYRLVDRAFEIMMESVSRVVSGADINHSGLSRLESELGAYISPDKIVSLKAAVENEIKHYNEAAIFEAYHNKEIRDLGDHLQAKYEQMRDRTPKSVANWVPHHMQEAISKSKSQRNGSQAESPNLYERTHTARTFTLSGESAQRVAAMAGYNGPVSQAFLNFTLHAYYQTKEGPASSFDVSFDLEVHSDVHSGEDHVHSRQIRPGTLKRMAQSVPALQHLMEDSARQTRFYMKDVPGGASFAGDPRSTKIYMVGNQPVTFIGEQGPNVFDLNYVGKANLPAAMKALFGYFVASTYSGLGKLLSPGKGK